MAKAMRWSSALFALGACSLWPVVAAAIVMTGVSAGDRHTCALTSTGGVKCWGLNGGGLGDGHLTTTSVAVDVAGLSSGMASLSPSGGFCGLTTAGGVKCWGSGFSVATDIPGLTSGVVAVTIGHLTYPYGSRCALTTAGGVKCWYEGQPPADAQGLTTGVAAITNGARHICVVTTSGGVKCVGENESGELGDGTNDSSPFVPVDVSGLSSGIAAVSGGSEHTCALTTSGGVKCWGRNLAGELGDGTNTSSNVPVDVSGLASGVAAVSAAARYTCALTTGGGVKCWGVGARIGDGSGSASNVPVDVSGLTSGVTGISAGGDHACAVTATGEVKCWGYNYEGSLGDGSTKLSSLPVHVVGLAAGTAGVTAGGGHSCAVTSAGATKCWGANGRGQLGDASTTLSATPVDVSGLSSGVAEVTAGYIHSCALTTAGAVSCWGDNDDGQLGDGSTTSSSVPVGVSGLGSGVTDIGAGTFHTCAVNGGAAVCWGANDAGQLGDGSMTSSSAPVPVSGLASGIAAVSAGELHACALTTAGGVKCWGRNTDGQLGDGSTASSSAPVDVVGLSTGIVDVSAGAFHTCAATTAGTLECWGRNDFGQLGNGGVTSSSVPVPVLRLTSGVVAVSAGDDHTCARTSDGAVTCWGSNETGQLGEGSCSNSPPAWVTDTCRSTRHERTRRRPTTVFGGASGITAVSAGSRHTCAVSDEGGVECWGANTSGQLGDGYGGSRAFASLVPVDVYLPGDLCPPTPDPACRTASRTQLGITEIGGRRDTVWKWKRGQPTDPVDFGNPTANTRYALCLYDGSGLVLAHEDMGWRCAGPKSCWKVVPDEKLVFGNRSSRYAEIEHQKIVMAGSDEDRARIGVRKSGEAIATTALPLMPPVTAQWRRTNNDVCWQSSYTVADVDFNTPGLFRARTN